MKHSIDPHAPIMGQLRAIGLPESLPRDRAMVYRFIGADESLLYVGVTISPRGRWQMHKNRSPWWPLVAYVSIEWHPHQRSSLDAEVAAIKAEAPLFNRRSSPAKFMSAACGAHTLLTRNVSLSLSRSLSRSLRCGWGPSMTSGSSPSRPGFEVDRGLLVAGLMDGDYAGMRGAW